MFALVSEIFIEDICNIFVFSNNPSIDVEFTDFLFYELFLFGFNKKLNCFHISLILFFFYH